MQNTSPTPAAELDDTLVKFAQEGLLKELGLHSNDVKAGLMLAKSQLDAGRVERALQIYCGLILLSPQEPETQLGLANCALQSQQYELTMRAAAAGMVLAPQDPRGFYFSGAAAIALGHLAEAKEDLADAVELAKAAKQADIAMAAQKLLSGLSAV
ncbi:hypothetical protein [Polycladidibacter hongkongensis]|uniref:hypothetical protein n=1 Tax=Polycladidibacter hongkongensis TaxID=1647556 RepID=UPI00082B0D0B|nr:hypothetical protein [Pseudovibrio hongkongensis]